MLTFSLVQPPSPPSCACSRSCSRRGTLARSSRACLRCRSRASSRSCSPSPPSSSPSSPLPHSSPSRSRPATGSSPRRTRSRSSSCVDRLAPSFTPRRVELTPLLAVFAGQRPVVRPAVLHPHDPGAPQCGASLLPLARASSRDPELTSLSPCSSSARRPHTSTPTSERLGRPLRPPARAPHPLPYPSWTLALSRPRTRPTTRFSLASLDTHTHTPPYVDTLRARPPRLASFIDRACLPLSSLSPLLPLAPSPSSPRHPLLLYFSATTRCGQAWNMIPLSQTARPRREELARELTRATIESDLGTDPVP